MPVHGMILVVVLTAAALYLLATLLASFFFFRRANGVRQAPLSAFLVYYSSSLVPACVQIDGAVTELFALFVLFRPPAHAPGVFLLRRRQ
jgi:hypothetical protein